jgi:hypothetical protein
MSRIRCVNRTLKATTQMANMPTLHAICSASSTLSTIEREVEAAISLNVHLHVSAHDLPVSMAPGVGWARRWNVIITGRGLGIEDRPALPHDSADWVIGEYHVRVPRDQPVAEICLIALSYRDFLQSTVSKAIFILIDRNPATSHLTGPVRRFSNVPHTNHDSVTAGTSADRAEFALSLEWSLTSASGLPASA